MDPRPGSGLGAGADEGILGLLGEATPRALIRLLSRAGLGLAVTVEDEQGDPFIARVNQALADILGATIEAVEGTQALSWATEDGLARILEQADEDLTEEGPILTTVRRADGSKAEVQAWPQAIQQGGRTVKLALVREITAQKRAQEALARQAAAIDAATDGIALLDDAGTLVYANTAFAESHGYASPEDLEGTPWRDHYPAEERRRIEATVVPALADHGRWRGELIGRRRDGSTFPQETTLSLVDGDHVVCILRDITQRRAAEAAIRESEDRYRSLVEVLPEGIAVARADGIIFANEGAVEMVGARSIDDLLGRCPADLVAPEDQETVDALVQAALDAEHLERITTCIERLDGGGLDVELAVSPTSFQGEPAAQLLFHDITELKGRQDELEALTAELEQRNQDLRDFAQVAGHDLKEPLRMVTGFLDLFQRRYGDTVEPEEAREFLEKAKQGGHQAQELLDGLVRFARVQSEQPDPTPVDSLQAVGKALSNLSMTVEETDAEVTWGQLPTVMADEAQLTQVFQNLIGNAIKHNEAGPPVIRIWAEPAGDAWRFHVADNGVGIAPEHQEAVFEPMRRLDRGKEGTGMGLAIVKRIVERHGGQVGLSSTPGKGTEITFTLPA